MRKKETSNLNEKPCTKCGEIKHVSEFRLIKKGVSAGKYNSWCKQCCNDTFRKYREKNPIAVMKARMKYDHSERGRDIKNNGLHIKRAGGRGGVTFEEWKGLKEKYGNKCLRCGATDKPLTKDHVIPISKGGEHIIENIQPLCKSCNSKNARELVDYRTL